MVSASNHSASLECQLPWSSHIRISQFILVKLPLGGRRLQWKSQRTSVEGQKKEKGLLSPWKNFSELVVLPRIFSTVNLRWKPLGVQGRESRWSQDTLTVTSPQFKASRSSRPWYGRVIFEGRLSGVHPSYDRQQPVSHFSSFLLASEIGLYQHRLKQRRNKVFPLCSIPWMIAPECSFSTLVLAFSWVLILLPTYRQLANLSTCSVRFLKALQYTILCKHIWNLDISALEVHTQNGVLLQAIHLKHLPSFSSLIGFSPLNMMHVIASTSPSPFLGSARGRAGKGWKILC